MTDEIRRLLPSPVALFLIAMLMVGGAYFIKTQRWHSPEPAKPPPPELPTPMGPDNGDAMMTSPAIRVLLRSSRQSLEPDAEGYPGRVEVVDAGGRYLRICHIDMDSYVAHVVTGELPNSWDGEIKRAQAVAARSYAMTEWDPDGLWDIKASALAQNFRKEETDAGAREAAMDTRGIVLRQGGRIVRAFYHATCGGSTVTPWERWGMTFPRIPAVACEHCHNSSLFEWSFHTDQAELSQLMSRDIEDLWVEAVDSTGRVQRVNIETTTGLEVMSGEDFRAAVGYRKLRSTWFRIERDQPVADDDDSAAGDATAVAIRFEGHGSGHGVGMCQWGGHGLAQKGMGWREILEYYYPGIDIDSVY